MIEKTVKLKLILIIRKNCHPKYNFVEMHWSGHPNTHTHTKR